MTATTSISDDPTSVRGLASLLEPSEMTPLVPLGGGEDDTPATPSLRLPALAPLLRWAPHAIGGAVLGLAVAVSVSWLHARTNVATPPAAVVTSNAAPEEANAIDPLGDTQVVIELDDGKPSPATVAKPRVASAGPVSSPHRAQSPHVAHHTVYAPTSIMPGDVEPSSSSPSTSTATASTNAGAHLALAPMPASYASR